MGERKRIGLREVRALQPGETAWDAAVPGFGVRRQRSEAVSYVLLYRTAGGRQRWHTIGRHGALWTPDAARDEARRLLGDVARGEDPAAEKLSKRNMLTMADLCTQYLADAEAGRLLVRGGRAKKPLTLASDRGRIEGHIIPLLGRLAVSAVTKQDIERFIHAVAAGETAQTRKVKPRAVSVLKGGQGVATRAVGLLGAIFTYAVDNQLRPDNPAHRIRKYAENRRERRLEDREYRMLGIGLERAAAPKPGAQGGSLIAPTAIAVVRFLILTGWRSGEALALRWPEVDLARRTATLENTKSGRSVRPLSEAACDILKAMPRQMLLDSKPNPLVFVATRGHGQMGGFKKLARKIFDLGGLPADITPHTLRHSFASLAGDLGYSEATIGALIGHKGHSVTRRYMHAADAVLLAAADAVARRTLELMSEIGN